MSTPAKAEKEIVIASLLYRDVMLQLETVFSAKYYMQNCNCSAVADVGDPFQWDYH